MQSSTCYQEWYKSGPWSIIKIGNPWCRGWSCIWSETISSTSQCISNEPWWTPTVIVMSLVLSAAITTIKTNYWYLFLIISIPASMIDFEHNTRKVHWRSTWSKIFRRGLIGSFFFGVHLHQSLLVTRILHSDHLEIILHNKSLRIFCACFILLHWLFLYSLIYHLYNHVI